MELVFVKRMIKLFKKFIYLSEVFLEIFAAFFVNIFSKTFFLNRKEDFYILIYSPYKDKPWILNKIINDIISISNNKKFYKVFNSLLELSIFKFKYGGNILSMHQSSLKKLYLAGFELNYISTCYTHSKLIQNGVVHLKKVKKVFCQNNYELSILKSSGISPEKLVSFPMAVHDNFLNIDPQKRDFSNREIDVIFSLRYFVDHQHYKIRKRYKFIINLANLLSNSNFKVCILGNGWEGKKIDLNEKILVHDVEFYQYPNFYQNSKIYCNVSLVEGGPISLVEAFSSGCKIFTTPTGLAFNLCLDDKLSTIIPFEKKETFWFLKIQEELNKRSINLEDKITARGKKIIKSSFLNLSNILEDNIYSA